MMKRCLAVLSGLIAVVAAAAPGVVDRARVAVDIKVLAWDGRIV